jgi:hypothetical protein
MSNAALLMLLYVTDFVVEGVREAKTAVELEMGKNAALYYDSLQLAHKCILNSFYGNPHLLGIFNSDMHIIMSLLVFRI